mmetsp:Transcript_39040/g.44527  ORF Transcript_39040/g.44527 Transcript_39040/m.44527 type:complete len:148 (+) Transcript_39040:266-709(+)|eukprot:CAMPEP_0194171256 /NCGR_PEP_ID=MMETSP0154-20130528/5859_1 /TAXON_ID=1049557 /ORGANISM="Thalassiothrix antarctica, Strain L6-D1" /LENGTH=147 /DNA_ID=CAMNT_0038883475 /DNA_START=169 /DNA_END=612 /DNA_ORIENTATION=-
MTNDNNKNNGASSKKKKKEVPMSALSSATVLIVQSIFLSGCGLYGAASNDWSSSAMHSAYAGMGAGLVLSICATLMMSGSYILYMIGVHIALLLQGLFVLVFGIQSYKASQDPAKADRLPLFLTMLLGSIVSLGVMIQLKPKKKKEA